MLRVKSTRTETQNVHSRLTPCASRLLKHRSKCPGRELLVAEALQLALGLLSPRDLDQFLEDLAADVLDRDAVQNYARVDVHVLDHSLVERRVRCDLENGRGLESEAGAAAG